ncbi:MAG: hypothetical protein KDB27_05200 [Planctomycetales bacterium]|nr:hypothetical protein [Planctomycetales bacterium]
MRAASVRRLRRAILLGCVCSSCCVIALGNAAADEQSASDEKGQKDALRTGVFRWRVGSPLLEIDSERLPPSPDHEWLAIKDPSVVRYQDRWHLFCSLRKNKEGDGQIRIGYLSFVDWTQAQQANWRVLELTPGYHGAPQIFYFEPQRKWYLIYQAEDQTRGLKYGPCFSTNADIADAMKWTLPEPLYVVKDGARAGLDFWVICDDEKALLFFTTLNGRMWRAETALNNFPDKGWSEPQVALKADIFEASHTYRVKDLSQYFTIVEAQAGKRRYFKGYVADRLDGEWTPLAHSRDKPLVSPRNVVNQEFHGQHLTATVSLSASDSIRC